MTDVAPQNCTRVFRFCVVVGPTRCSRPDHGGVEPWVRAGWRESFKPKAWTVSGDGFATDAPGYEVRLDEAEAKSGKRSLRMKGTGRGGFGNAFLQIPADVAAGKRVKISGWIKTKDVGAKGYAGLWCRIDGPGGMLSHDNMAVRIDAKGTISNDDRGVRGTTDWKRYNIQHDVPSSAKAIVFGALLTTEGTAWWDDFAVEIDGKPYQGKSLAELALEREPKPAELHWLRKYAIAFKTERAESGFDDLQPLKAIIGDAHIVGLGEGTHGTAEFFRMKHRLVEFLASEKGFTLFAIEANMPEAYRVNDYVLDGKGDPKALLRGMYFWTWDTQEVLDMILWMRRFNASGKGRIQFLGFDMQTAAVAAENARKFVADLDPAFAKAAALAYDGLDTAIIQSRAALDEDRRGRGRDRQDESREEGTRCRRAQAHGGGPSAIHREEACGPRRLGNPERPRRRAGGRVDGRSVFGRPRSSRPLYGRQRSTGSSRKPRPAPRSSCGAHNGHVSRTAMGSTSMGSHLAKRHGKDYVVLGFAAHQGRYTAVGRGTGVGTHNMPPSQPGSVEYYAHASGLPRMIIDLRRASKDDPSSAWLTRPLDHRSIGAVAHNASYPSLLPDEYDALIAFDATTASKCFRFAQPK